MSDKSNTDDVEQLIASLLEDFAHDDCRDAAFDFWSARRAGERRGDPHLCRAFRAGFDHGQAHALLALKKRGALVVVSGMASDDEPSGTPN